jgi:RNA polymerase sigma factor FliA
VVKYSLKIIKEEGEMGRKRKAVGNGNGNGKWSLSSQEKEEVILQCCSLVKFMALRLASRLPNNIQSDDLFSAGVIGLIDAIEKFDPTQGIQFETYAKIRIRGAMLDEIRSMDWVPRSLRRKSHRLEKAYSVLEQKLGRNPTDEEIAQELNITVEEYFHLLDEVKGISIVPADIQELQFLGKDLKNGMSIPELGWPFYQCYALELRELIKKEISNLPEKEQLVLAMYYYDELTMKEIGGIMGYTETRISQLHTKAVLRLRNKISSGLRKNGLKMSDLSDSCGASHA